MIVITSIRIVIMMLMTLLLMIIKITLSNYKSKINAKCGIPPLLFTSQVIPTF